MARERLVTCRRLWKLNFLQNFFRKNGMGRMVRTEEVRSKWLKSYYDAWTKEVVLWYLQLQSNLKWDLWNGTMDNWRMQNMQIYYEMKKKEPIHMIMNYDDYENQGFERV